MKALENVQGRFNAQSTGQLDCNIYDKMKKDNVIKGKETCKTGDNPTNANGVAGTTDQANSKSNSKSTTSTGAAAINAVTTPVAGVAALFYALAQLV